MCHALLFLSCAFLPIFVAHSLQEIRMHDSVFAGRDPLPMQELRKAGWSYVLLTVRFRTNEMSTVRLL